MPNLLKLLCKSWLTDVNSQIYHPSCKLCVSHTGVVQQSNLGLYYNRSSLFFLNGYTRKLVDTSLFISGFFPFSITILSLSRKRASIFFIRDFQGLVFNTYSVFLLSDQKLHWKVPPFVIQFKMALGEKLSSVRENIFILYHAKISCMRGNCLRVCMKYWWAYLQCFGNEYGVKAKR